MKIRRFQAPTMREALAGVRDELGAEAVIISTRRVDGGLEVIAAADYDAGLVAGTLAGLDTTAARRPAATPAPAAVEVADPAPARGFQSILARMTGTGGARAAAATERDPPPAGGAGQDELAEEAMAGAAPGAARPRMVWSQDEGIVAMRRELAGLRSMLEYQLARLAWDDLARREPFRASVLRDLSSLDIAPDLARRLANSMPAVTRPEDASRVALALLVRHLPMADDRLMERGGCFALVGSTGAGKTTTVAKLAAAWAQRHGPQSVGLISIDGYRIGAREQLAAFARMLDVPMRVARHPDELKAALAAFRDRRLVLVDTAGVGQRDLRLREQAALVASQAGALQPLLVLPANADLASLDDTVRAHAPLRPAACIVTKIDETASLGPVLSAAMRASLPITRLCDGPRVPDDLHVAGPKRVWLVRRAVKLRSLSGRVADDEYLADHFGGQQAHA